MQGDVRQNGKEMSDKTARCQTLPTDVRLCQEAVVQSEQGIRSGLLAVPFIWPFSCSSMCSYVCKEIVVEGVQFPGGGQCRQLSDRLMSRSATGVILGVQSS